MPTIADILDFIDARKRALMNNVDLMVNYPDVFSARMKEGAAGQ